jgi:hypothetical protein
MTLKQRSTSNFSVAELFAPLDGETFEGEAAFQHAVIDRFNQHLDEFPPHYDYRDAITWAVRQSWIQVEGAQITVALADMQRREPLSLAA